MNQEREVKNKMKSHIVLKSQINTKKMKLLTE
jgi:hypothetical protein